MAKPRLAVADLELERTVGPADEGCDRFPEEDMHNEIVEIGAANGEKDMPGQELLNHHRGADGALRPGDGNKGKDQSEDQEFPP